MAGIYSLDIETKSLVPDKPYALEPFRYRQGKAKILSVDVARPDGITSQSTHVDGIKNVLIGLEGQQVYAHNATFDVGWLITVCGYEVVSKIKWRDTYSLAKWINNGQKMDTWGKDRLSLTLKDLVLRYVKEHPNLAEFLAIKDQEDDRDEDYWRERGTLDTIMTRVLAIEMLKCLPKAQSKGYFIDQACIAIVARSWADGIPVNKKAADELAPRIIKARNHLANVAGTVPTVISSPKQLSNYLFNTLGLKPIGFTDSGAPSTSKDNLLHLSNQHMGTPVGKKIQAICDCKQLNTLKSKFIDGITRLEAWNGEPVCYASPMMFGTYTGRFTYSSKTQKKQTQQTSVALHQIARKGPTRTLIEPPEGMAVGELDASGQEMRFMGFFSQDRNMVDGFNQGINHHSAMGARIAGRLYNEFHAAFKGGDEVAKEYRQAGKLLNLSCQYRIGWKALREKFFTTYGIVISPQTAMMYLTAYKTQYPGVPDYWSDIISLGQTNGYAESIAKRRYKLTDWRSRGWATESSAINFPIQGSGADHKYLAIALLGNKFPEAKFCLDLHDGLFFFLDMDNKPRELILCMRDYLNRVDFHDIWGVDDRLKFTFDAGICDFDNPSIGSIKEI